MPTPDEQRAIIARYVDTINARDAGALGLLFATDAVQADPASNPPNVGREAITAFFDASIAASESWEFRAKAVHTCADHVAIDFAISLVTGGAPMSIEGIEIFVIGEDGLITSVHAYWDDSDIAFG